MAESPTTALRAVCKQILNDILPDTGWTIHDGKLHASLGSIDDGGPRAGVSPIDDVPLRSNHNALGPLVLVQVYGQWEKIVDNTRVVDPGPIEQLAEDFRNACRESQDVASEEVWFLRVERITYPDDPVGQKTRFHAEVRGMTANSATVLRETGP